MGLGMVMISAIVTSAPVRRQAFAVPAVRAHRGEVRLALPEGLPRPVRVCFMIDELYTGGTESQLLALIRALDRTRVHPSLCLLRGERPGSRALEPDDCPVLRLGVGSLCHPATLGKARRLAQF